MNSAMLHEQHMQKQKSFGQSVIGSSATITIHKRMKQLNNKFFKKQPNSKKLQTHKHKLHLAI